jgi:hypothetical protein
MVGRKIRAAIDCDAPGFGWKYCFPLPFLHKILIHTDNAMKAAIPWISAFHHLQETV